MAICNTCNNRAKLVRGSKVYRVGIMRTAVLPCKYYKCSKCGEEFFNEKQFNKIMADVNAIDRDEVETETIELKNHNKALLILG